MLLTNLDYMTDRCQTDVICQQLVTRRLTPSVTNVNCACRHFIATSFFLYNGCAYSQSFCKFFGVPLYMFLSVNHNDETIIQ